MCNFQRCLRRKQLNLGFHYGKFLGSFNLIRIIVLVKLDNIEKNKINLEILLYYKKLNLL